MNHEEQERVSLAKLSRRCTTSGGCRFCTDRSGTQTQSHLRHLPFARVRILAERFSCIGNAEFPIQENKMVIGGIGITIFFCFAGLLIEPKCVLLLILLGGCLILPYVCVAKRRYQKLQELNSYLSLVCSGHYELDVADNTEGELSILKNNLYKVILLLRTQNELLEKDKEYLTDTLTDISHQLKTPMTSIMIMVDLLKEEGDGEKRQEFLVTTEHQLEKMKWLISSLLKVAKLDAGTIEFNKEEISLQELLRESIEPFTLTMDLREITLQMEVEEDSIKADRNWTIEAFGNIVKNCLEHMEDKGTLAIWCTKTSIYTAVHIKDDGCGIAKEDLPHIFERFYHGKHTSKDSVGIGLALAQTILEKEHGKILVSSQYGEGTEFEIRFYKAVV